MEMSQENSLYSYLKQMKMSSFFLKGKRGKKKTHRNKDIKVKNTNKEYKNQN
jgi:uncharacterized membrane protein affecting hemolysin expression